MKKKILVLDTYGLIYKTYFAFYNNPLMTNTGLNISSVYGVFNSLYTLIEKLKPDYIISALDSIGKTFRHERYPDYKANREKTPEDLHEQIPIIEELLNIMQVQTIRVNGFEADDIIATITKQFDAQEYDVYIFSTDKDLLQLLNDSVFIVKFDKSHGLEIIKKDDVVKIWGVDSEKMLDLLSLIGDASDNVKGVDGIGIKTAQKILTCYDDVETFFSNIESDTNFSTSIKNKMINGIESFRTAKSLIQLYYDVPLSLDFHIDRYRYQDLVERFKYYQLPSLAKKYTAFFSSSDKQNPVNKNEDKLTEKIYVSENKQNPNIFYRILNETDFTFTANKYCIQNSEELKLLLIKNATVKLCAFSLFSDEKVIYLSFCFDSKVVYYYSFNIEVNDFFLADDYKENINILQSFFSNSSICFIMYDAKPILKYLKKISIISNFNLNVFDISIAIWLLHSNLSNYSIENIFKQFNLDILSKEQTFEYLCLCIEFSFTIFPILSTYLNDTDIKNLYYDIELSILPILCEMEENGIFLSVSELDAFSNEIGIEIQTLEKYIFQLAGHSFNILSPKQLQTVLYNEKKLKPTKKIKTGFSTDDESLEALIDDDEIIEYILNYRKLTKLQSTYAVSLQKLVDSNGFIHTTFLQTGTATGRLSSKDPNLQNIPIREEIGRKIRHAFYAPKNNVLVSADYSQIELVILAHLSKDKSLCKAFKNGIDVHAQTASLIYNVDVDDVLPDMRRISKVINFGVIYGMSAFRLANELKISRTQAKNFIDAYFNNYSGVAEFLERTKQEALKYGYVKTILGRRRYIPEISSSNKIIKSAAERIAINSPIQGSASEIVKLAMIKIKEEIIKNNLSSKILLQVHDEVIFSTPETEITNFTNLLKETFESVFKLSVPLRVTIDYGKSWGDFH